MKEMIKRMREEKGGFTIAELLIVVAIIAVLVAIAIPVFTSSLANAQAATDQANCRSYYGYCVTKNMNDKEAPDTMENSTIIAAYEGVQEYALQQGTLTVAKGTNDNTYTYTYTVKEGVDTSHNWAQSFTALAKSTQS